MYENNIFISDQIESKIVVTDHIKDIIERAKDYINLDMPYILEVLREQAKRLLRFILQKC